MSSPFLVSRNGAPLAAELHGAVVAIGNFDGVHRGHQHLIGVTKVEAQKAGRPSVVLTFEPHPRTFFNPKAPLYRLTPEPVKLAILQRLGIDGVIIRPFDADLAVMTAEEFVTRLLVEDLGAAGVVIGHDFHFGRGRQGNPERLEELCREHGLTCLIVPVVAEAGRIVSSSAIRSALEEGNISAANDLLGYRWFVSAPVGHGDKRGRTLGFPTANLSLGETCRLSHGIYAVRARVADRILDGVASFGRRPTFDDGAPLLEVFLFDFAGDLYGQVLDVEFVQRIRGEERFATADALVGRMHEDAAAAKAILRADATPSMLEP
jgi:riboflavin kinase / FMN adenylyltransferase